MKYRTGQEARVGDQVLGITKSGQAVAGVVLTLNAEKSSVQVSPSIQGSVWVPAAVCVPAAELLPEEEKPPYTAPGKSESNASDTGEGEPGKAKTE